MRRYRPCRAGALPLPLPRGSRPLRRASLRKISEVLDVADYEKMYKIMFNGIRDAIEDLEQQNNGFAKLNLIETQQAVEEIFLESEERGKIASSPDGK